jgi:hypothetical protein
MNWDDVRSQLACVWDRYDKGEREPYLASLPRAGPSLIDLVSGHNNLWLSRRLVTLRYHNL